MTIETQDQYEKDKDAGEFKKGGSKARGFAANPEKINRGGRPKNSRNKSTLVKAQLQLDDMSMVATDILQAIMTNDKDVLGLGEDQDVPLTLRLSAAKEALNKAIANEKDKEPNQPVKETNTEEDKKGPIFSTVPIAKKA